MLLCGSCTKLVYEVPETITISGHVTDEDGQPVENVGLSLMCIQSSNLLGFYVGTGIYGSTDANGYYSIEFNPKQGYSYRMDIGKGGYHSVPSYSVDRWIASQEHNVVLRKNTEYVDLGLPSRLLWATCNVGATKPEGLGDYFAWAEISPKAIYSWENYEYCNAVSNQLTKYCNNPDLGNGNYTDTRVVLEAEDDVAQQSGTLIGSGWRMPTKDDFTELKDTRTNTTLSWTWCNGSDTRYRGSTVKGWRIVNDVTHATLFLPAAGFRSGQTLALAGSDGYYWSSSLKTDDPTRAWFFYFGSDGLGQSYYARYNGLSVRPVRN